MAKLIPHPDHDTLISEEEFAALPLQTPVPRQRLEALEEFWSEEMKAATEKAELYREWLREALEKASLATFALMEVRRRLHPHPPTVEAQTPGAARSRESAPGGAVPS